MSGKEVSDLMAMGNIGTMDATIQHTEQRARQSTEYQKEWSLITCAA
jgi:hypothetical protein